jgi:hypothetical protein
MVFLAASFSFAGTESSRSRQTTSASSVFALSTKRALAPGTKMSVLNIIYGERNEKRR